MTPEQTSQLNEIIIELVRKLDITDTEFDTLTKSYQTVGNYLAEESSPLYSYSPEIRPQGSFLLGTVVRPVSDDADIDIDLVCELTNKPANWTQYNLKEAVGDRLKDHQGYKGKLDKEGKRCWTIIYGDGAYHMDILPSLMKKDYGLLLERSFSNDTLEDLQHPHHGQLQRRPDLVQRLQRRQDTLRHLRPPRRRNPPGGTDLEIRGIKALCGVGVRPRIIGSRFRGIIRRCFRFMLRGICGFFLLCGPYGGDSQSNSTDF